MESLSHRSHSVHEPVAAAPPGFSILSVRVPKERLLMPTLRWLELTNDFTYVDRRLGKVRQEVGLHTESGTVKMSEHQRQGRTQ
jgi:hypothetical protein